MIRHAMLVAALLLGACSTGNDLDEAPAPLGDFALGHNVVVAPNLVQGPLSREATPDEWTAAVKSAVAQRFDRYQSEKLYNFGISVEGYVLAQPGVPLVMAPKSVLIVRLTVWDDAEGRKLNEEPEEITVIESLGDGALIGSGYTLTREEQIERLSRGMAKQIEKFLVKQNRYEGWFGGPGAKPVITTAENRRKLAEIAAARPAAATTGPARPAAE
ncbi:hypothetical protein E0K89_016475 [Aquicoccus sp. SCR17]|nr:hypothetical protein [Carideicomes alvinocaridis]